MVNTSLRNKEKAELTAIKNYVDLNKTESNKSFKLDFINNLDNTLPANPIEGLTGLIKTNQNPQLVKHIDSVWTNINYSENDLFFYR
jgi:hypothetical protein